MAMACAVLKCTENQLLVGKFHFRVATTYICVQYLPEAHNEKERPNYVDI